jgi:hypothetical protein
MSTFRCPKHDVVFESLTDQRKPGATAAKNFPAHPVNGHPDCPQCQAETKAEIGKTSVGNTGVKTIPTRTKIG